MIGSSTVTAVTTFFTTRRHGQAVLSAVRVGYGLTTALMLLVNLPVRSRLWGTQAAYDWEAFVAGSLQAGQPSLYALSSSAVWADFLYFGTVVAAILFALGWHTRVVAVVFFVLLWSLHVRNPVVTNGGDNIMRIVLLYMIIARTDTFWSWRAYRGQRPPGRLRQAVEPYAIVANNVALVACVVQVCVLYVTSGLFKVQGRMWQEGTALYYVMRTADYNTWPELTRLIYQWPAVVVIATYAAVFVQVFLPVSLLDQRLKRVLLPLVLGMHLAIGLLMGLPYFSLFMIVTDLFFLRDKELRDTLAALKSHSRRILRRQSPEARPTPGPATVFSLPGGRDDGL